jgi:cardiolipin synthase
MKAHNTYSGKRAGIWTVANLLTLSRVVFVPLFMMLFARQRFLAGFVTICLMGFTDILDGWVARKTRSASRVGALLDVSADCTVVFALQVFLLARDEWPAGLLIANAASALSFLWTASLRGRISKSRVGQYVGAVMMVVLAAKTLCAAVCSGAWARIISVGQIPVLVFVLVSVIENIAAALSAKETNAGGPAWQR